MGARRMSGECLLDDAVGAQVLGRLGCTARPRVGIVVPRQNPEVVRLPPSPQEQP